VERFRQAGDGIRWRTVPGARPRAQIAHLNDEESRVEVVDDGPTHQLRVESGPVGALVLLLEIAQRGPATELWAVETTVPPFPRGMLVARWGSNFPQGTAGHGIELTDLVTLARYALA
jgi:hypothetical protein